MATSKRKITFYFDEEAQAIIEKIPSFYRSATLRDVIKRAAAEGWFNTMPLNTIGIATASAAAQSKPDAAPPAPPTQDEDANHSEFPEIPAEGEHDELLDGITEGDPPGPEVTGEEETPKEDTSPTPPVETVGFTLVEDSLDPEEETPEREKPPQPHRTLQDAFLARVKAN